MKAMRKEPERRYATVQELIDDVRGLSRRSSRERPAGLLELPSTQARDAQPRRGHNRSPSRC